MLAQNRVRTLLVGQNLSHSDNRTTALLGGSISALGALGVWTHCSDKAAPLRVIRIVDDTDRLWRAPEVKFAAAELGLDAFGYNIENRDLVAALTSRARELPELGLADDQVVAVFPRKDSVAVSLRSGRSVSAELVISADGRQSMCRKAAGISFRERNYSQVALTVCLRHSRSHDDASTEFHTRTGPFTLVPLPGNRSSLVWVVDSSRADELAAASDVDLANEIEHASHSILGKITVEPGRAVFPLHAAVATPFAEKRIALVGEAAHVIPPIGAQGLNLGLRDAAAIGELIVSALRGHRDPGDADVLARYERMRRADVETRALAIDLVNRSLLSDFLPVQGARGLSLYLLGRIGPLRRAIMREGIAPALSEPRLMRGEIL